MPGPIRTQPKNHAATSRNTPVKPKPKKPEDLSKPDPTNPIHYLRAKFGPLKFRYGDYALHEMNYPEYKHWIKMTFPLGMGGADFNLKFEPETGDIVSLSFASRSIVFHSIDKWKDDFARRVNSLEELGDLFSGLIAFHNETMHRGQIRLMSKAIWPDLTKDVLVRTNESSFLTPPVDPLRNGKGNKCKRNAVPLSNQTIGSASEKDERAYLDVCTKRGALVLKPAFWQPDLSVNQLTPEFTIAKGTSNFVINWAIELEGDGEIKRHITIKVNKHCYDKTTCDCAEHFQQEEVMNRRFHEIRHENGIFRAIEEMVAML